MLFPCFPVSTCTYVLPRVETANINWNISLEAEGEAAIELEAAGTDAHESSKTNNSDTATETLLENNELRNLFLSDLLEVTRPFSAFHCRLQLMGWPAVESVPSTKTCGAQFRGFFMATRFSTARRST